MADNEEKAPAVSAEKETVDDKTKEKDIKINLNKEVSQKQQNVNKNNIDFSEIEHTFNKEGIFP